MFASHNYAVFTIETGIMADLSFRTIFISDVHLGTKNCKAVYLLDLLQKTHAETIYLVGDILDVWAMTKRVVWSNTQSAVLQTLKEKAQQGTKVIYIPGNHDYIFREFSGTEFHGISIQQNAVHITPQGKRLFVSHGDEFDGFIKHNHLLRFFGDRSYSVLLWLSRFNDKCRYLFKLPYWSLSAYLKKNIKNANQYIEKYVQAALNRAKHTGYDGYICGHIHKADLRLEKGLLYCNTGDWVEHCTTLIEEHDGTLKIMHWSDHQRVLITQAAPNTNQSDQITNPLPSLVDQALDRDKNKDQDLTDVPLPIRASSLR
ncbi:MAG TPA: UDP-2,3-diacylglucosamine diphosphatase [Thiothrix sp.]|nr:UDP-2,3-diacylglucosamine diphosphatase [Thiothrix sp.]